MVLDTTLQGKRMTFKRRFIIILISNTVISILAMGFIPAFAFSYLSVRRYENTYLYSPKPFHKELYGRLTGNDEIIKNLKAGPKLTLIMTRDRGVIYSNGKLHLRNFDYNNALDGLKYLNEKNFKFRAETFQYYDDYGIFVFEIDRKSIADNIRVYMVPFTLFLLGIFVVGPAIINFSLLFNLKKSFFKLEIAADKVSKGEYELNLKRKSKDELYSFYQSFNRMALTLKENRDEKARLLMSISHDLKTPLTSMKGYIEAFNDNLVPVNKTQRYHNIIKDKTLMLEDRINSLIDFAKLETADWIKTFNNIEIYPLLLEIAQSFKEDCIIYNRDFSYLLHVPYGVSILGDPKLLMRAIENLLENAKRYTSENGKIELNSSIENNTLYINIIDNGKGIFPEDLIHIFKPFYKVDKGRNSVGMGMGLYNVKTIIESHGGVIKCESEVNKWSKFIISFPLRSV